MCIQTAVELCAILLLKPRNYVWCESAVFAVVVSHRRGMADEEERSTREAQEILAAMETYNPIIPDAVTEYFLSLSGYQSTDPRVTRIASLAAHKFIADLTNDALRICKMRQQGKGRLVLTTEDLAQSARDYGIHIRKPPYFADVPARPANDGGGA